MPIGKLIGMDIATDATAEHRGMNRIVGGDGGSACCGRGREDAGLHEKPPA
jgi:hypothetical protein